MTRSSELFARAQRTIPGGVNSPVRAFGSVGSTPPFIARGTGSRIVDVDGKEYIDCVMSWGPLLLGHAHPAVVQAVADAAANGSTFGAPTEGEIELAELIAQTFPAIQKVRLVSSGTEATMSAVRLARGVTGRDVIIKFEGCYHGHADSFLIKSGSGTLTHGFPSSPGVPAAAAADTLNATYNDLSSVEELFASNPGRIACVIVEPVAGNMGVVLPAPGFLQGLRDLTTRHGALLIFDEVITGFRLAPGGAQEFFGVMPDLTTLGKIIGGGLPMGAFGGPADIMDHIAPLGPVYQAGTLSGNPCAVAAGLATLRQLLSDSPYTMLSRRMDYLFSQTRPLFEAAGLGVCENHIGSMGTIFFGVKQAQSYQHIGGVDTKRYARFHGAMLSHGIYLAPSQYEALFISTAHSEQDIEIIIEAVKQSITQL
jgi:glutamate-1-semialdehyde 2,1-aminomutase